MDISQKYSILFLGILLTLSSCDKRRTPDVSDISLDVEVLRFEEDLMAADPANMAEVVPKLQDKYGDFLLLFSREIIGIGSPENPSYPELLRQFVTDYMINDVYKAVQQTFGDFTPIADDLKKGLKYYHHHFPERKVPDLVTYISGFNHSVAVTDSMLGIGLDKYLGPENDYYYQLGYEQYRRYTLRPEKIPSDAMKAMALTYFLYNDSADNLLNQMIYQGRALYFSKNMLPWQPDTLIFGFTAEELKFCRNNEGQMWSYLIEYKLLFETDHFVIQKFIGNAPFTKEFTNESPGQAAVWLGYKIVEAYMNEKKEMTLAGLMEIRDYQQILRESNYQPK